MKLTVAAICVPVEVTICPLGVITAHIVIVAQLHVPFSPFVVLTQKSNFGVGLRKRQPVLVDEFPNWMRRIGRRIRFHAEFAEIGITSRSRFLHDLGLLRLAFASHLRRGTQSSRETETE